MIFGCVFAEKIQDVEYHLPKVAQDWVIGNKLENDKGTTIIYIPKMTSGIHNEEFFGVSANIYHTDINDFQSIKTALTKMFPNTEVGFIVLEKDASGMIYEWSIQEGDLEKVHGWGRVFAIKEGTVLLNYQTEKTSDIAKARSIWLPVLKEAH